MLMTDYTVKEILYSFYFVGTDFKEICAEYEELPPLLINGIITGQIRPNIFNEFMTKAEHRENL
ncbi:hypothetical protein [Salinicoccus carnicancri]|uniref:hypothetical protein n=1 Tax=Salinicoccus carnicancri TaxID=558170 RepID=UPI0003747998|nr:hypothetical protein [Salinicoccus carnicancri]